MPRLITAVLLAICFVAPALAAPVVAPPQVAKPVRSFDNDLAAVKKAIAQVMQIKTEAIEPKQTLTELKVTNLDLADIRETLETRLKIELPMAALKKAAGAEDNYKVVDKLTVSRLAGVVNAAPRAK